MAARLNLPTTGWQVDRRNALTLLQRARDKAMRERHYTHADAYLLAALDVEQELRARAGFTIAESTTMPFAHPERRDHIDAMLSALPAGATRPLHLAGAV